MAKATKSAALTLKPSEALEYIQLMIEVQRPAMLWGPPGIGKSSIVKQLAKQIGYEVLDLRLSQMNPEDLRGIPMPVDDGNGGKLVYWVVPGVFPRGENDRVVVFLDEINTAPQSVQSAAYQLVLDRQLGEYHLPENCYVIAAGNRDTDRGATFRMAEPLKNRFGHIELQPDTDEFLQYAIEHDFDDSVIAYLFNQPGELFVFDPGSSSYGFPTPRTWEFSSDAIKSERFQKMNLKLKTATVGGFIGDGNAIKFMDFYQNSAKLPRALDILTGKIKKISEINVSQSWSLVINLCRELSRMYEESKAPDSEFTDKHFYQMANNMLTFLMDNVSKEFLVFGMKTGMNKFNLPLLNDSMPAVVRFMELVGDDLVD